MIGLYWHVLASGGWQDADCFHTGAYVSSACNINQAALLGQCLICCQTNLFAVMQSLGACEMPGRNATNRG